MCVAGTTAYALPPQFCHRRCQWWPWPWPPSRPRLLLLHSSTTIWGEMATTKTVCFVYAAMCRSSRQQRQRQLTHRGGGSGSGVQLCNEKSRRQASTCTAQSSRLTSQQMVTTVTDFHSELLCMHQYQGHCWLSHIFLIMKLITVSFFPLICTFLQSLCF